MTDALALRRNRVMLSGIAVAQMANSIEGVRGRGFELCLQVLIDDVDALMAVAVCRCGCARDDHFEPDWYDPRTQGAYADGHLNHCGDCAECYYPEYAAREELARGRREGA